MSGLIITDVKRFAVHDGDGIRTTVFFKGCPLRCAWCHNPETHVASPEIGVYTDRCVRCAECAAVCPAHTFVGGEHLVDRSSCVGCGRCAERCPADAITLYGRPYTVDALIGLLLEDRPYYEASGGGITLSGGECLLYPDACAEILRAMKREGIRTAVDTCGAVPYENIEKVRALTDVFLYDIKAIDPAVHRRCTGVTNERILENLRRIDALGAVSEIRYPFVPGYNDEECEKIAAFVSSLRREKGVRILPYHDFAKTKYRALGREYAVIARVPTKEETDRAADVFRRYGIKVIGE